MSENIFHPESEKQFSEAISEAFKESKRVSVLGNGSRYPIPSEVVKISAKHLKETHFFNPEDMVYGVSAGKTAGEIQAELGERNMYLPLDPFSADTTIGSCVACNDYGPSRLFMGGLRDYLIGVSYVNATGKTVKGGGKVVKNVAGYDLMKMMLGSKGGFGAITRVHFKVVPKPLNKTAYIRLFSDASWIAGLKKVLEKKVPLASLELVAADGNFVLDARFEGVGEKVARIQTLLEDFLGKGDCIEESDDEKLGRFVAVKNCNLSNQEPILKQWGIKKGDLRFRFDCPSSVILEEAFCEKLLAIDARAKLVIHPFGGDIQFVLGTESFGEQSAAIAKTLGLLRGKEAHFELLSGSPGIFSDYPFPFGDHAVLDRKLKKSLDPADSFYSPYFEFLFQSESKNR